MTISRPLILFPYLSPCLTYGVIDPFGPRNPTIGVYAFVCLRYLLLIHKGLPYPKMRHVGSYYLLRCLMRPDILPQILHSPVPLSLTRADARPGLCHCGSAHRRT
jgi:hypothetical protein